MSFSNVSGVKNFMYNSYQPYNVGVSSWSNNINPYATVDNLTVGNLNVLYSATGQISGNGGGVTGPTGSFGATTFTWNLVNTRLVSSNSIVKNAAGSWNAKAYSSEAYGFGAYMSFQPGQSNADISAGFVATPTNPASSSWIDYGWLCDSAGNAQPINSGLVVGPVVAYGAGDTFQVNYDGFTLYYYKNGAVIHTQSLAVFSTSPFHLGVVMDGSTSTRVNMVHFGPQSIAPPITGPNLGYVRIYYTTDFAGGIYLSDAIVSPNISTGTVTITASEPPAIVIAGLKPEFTFPSSIQVFGAGFSGAAGISGDPSVVYWNYVQTVNLSNLRVQYFPPTSTVPNYLVISNASSENLGIEFPARLDQFTSGNNVLSAYMVFNLTTVNP